MKLAAMSEKELRQARDRFHRAEAAASRLQGTAIENEDARISISLAIALDSGETAGIVNEINKLKKTSINAPYQII